MKLARGPAALGASLLLGGCFMSDPAFDPIAHQRDGNVLILLVPLCSGERVESVELEDTADGHRGSLYKRSVENPASTEQRIDLREAPALPKAATVVISVATTRRIRSSTLDLPEVPEAAAGKFRLDDHLVTRQEVLNELSCGKDG